MAGYIRPNRNEVTRQLPVLGFTIRTGHRPAWFEVVLATDPALFRDASARTAVTFYSTRAEGPLSAPAGEGVYLVPPRVMSRFVGREKLYYALAVYRQPDFRSPEVATLPPRATPYVHISKSFTGQERGASGWRGRRAGADDTYGDAPATLTWGGDEVQPGAMEPAAPATPGAASGDGAPGGAPPAVAAPAAGAAAASQGSARQASALTYDDGFDPALWNKPSDQAMTPDLTHRAHQGRRTVSSESGALQEGDLVLLTPPAAVPSAGLSTADPALRQAAVYVGNGEVVTFGGQGGTRQRIERAGSEPAAYREPGMTTENARAVADAVRSPADLGLSHGTAAPLFVRHRAPDGVSVDLEPGEGAGFFAHEPVLEAYRRAGYQLTGPMPAGTGAPNPSEVSLARRLRYVGHVETVPEGPLSGGAGFHTGLPAPSRALNDGATPVTFHASSVSCADYPRSYPIFTAIGTTDPVGVIQTAATKAVELLDRTIGELEHARGQIVDGGGQPAWPAVSDHTAASLRTRMLLDPSDRAVWTGTAPRTVFFLVRWLKNIRQILAGGHIKYTCLDVDKDCPSGTWASAIPGEMRIYLCRKWWRGGDGDLTDEVRLLNRASSLIHEASHIYYSTVDDSGRGIWRADCLEQLVSDLSGEHIPAAFEESCGPQDLSQAQGYQTARGLQAGVRHGGGDGYGAGYPVPSRAFSGASFDVNWSDVYLVPQLTGMSCWAAAAAMVVGWRNRQSFNPADIASGSGFWSAYQQGLNLSNVDDLGRAWGLVVEPPQSYSVEGLRRLIEHSGPIWMSMAVPSGHAVVIRGIYGDGTPGGTFVRVLDPWPPGQGATYDLSIEGMAQRYEDLISVDAQGNVNAQVLHAGGRDGAQAQGYGGYAARAQTHGNGHRAGHPISTRAFSGASFDVNWSDIQLVPQLTGMSCWAAAGAMVVGWRDRISINPTEIASGSGFWSAYTSGLWPRDHDDMGRAWGLVVEPPQSYSMQGLRELIEYNGPLWLGIEVPSGSGEGGYGHAVVITGIYGDGTVPGTRLRVLDPAPMGQGARYEWTIPEFAQRYERRVTVEPDGSVNVQVLHAGGRNGSQAQGYRGYAARAQAAGARHARGMSGGGEIASAIAGAAMTAVLQNPGGGLSLRLEQLHGKKYPGDDRASEGSGAYQNKVVELSGWPSMASVLGADQVYANLRIDFDYNGRTVGNVRITDVGVNEAAGASLDVTATIMDDAQLYLNQQGETIAAVQVVVRYRFSGWNADRTAVADLKLYGDGRYSRQSAWTDEAAHAMRYGAREAATY